MYTCSSSARRLATGQPQARQQRQKLPPIAAAASRSRVMRPIAANAVTTDVAVAAKPQKKGRAPAVASDSASACDDVAATVSVDDMERIASGSQTSSSGRTVGNGVTWPGRLTRHSSAWLTEPLDGGWHVSAQAEARRVSGQADEHQSAAARRSSDQQPIQASPAASSGRDDSGLGDEEADRDEQPQPLGADDGEDMLGGPSPPAETAERPATELIFRLERRGDGWGEEIFPHLVLEQRPLEPPRRRVRKRSSRPDPWEVCPRVNTAPVSSTHIPHPARHVSHCKRALCSALSLEALTPVALSIYASCPGPGLSLNA
jgi:hypothetical protein